MPLYLSNWIHWSDSATLHGNAALCSTSCFFPETLDRTVRFLGFWCQSNTYYEVVYVSTVKLKWHLFRPPARLYRFLLMTFFFLSFFRVVVFITSLSYRKYAPVAAVFCPFLEDIVSWKYRSFVSCNLLKLPFILYFVVNHLLSFFFSLFFFSFFFFFFLRIDFTFRPPPLPPLSNQNKEKFIHLAVFKWEQIGALLPPPIPVYCRLAVRYSFTTG